MIKPLLAVAISFFLLSCATKEVFKYEGSDINVNQEFDKVVKVKTVKKPPPVKRVESKPKAKVTKKEKAPKKGKKKEKSKEKTKTVKQESPKPKPHLPKMEDGEGFDGRRPIVDPYRVGERVVLAMTYLNMHAGDMILETLPFKDVNGNTAYHFSVKVKSSPFFSRLYKVDDSAETFVDFNTLRPYTMVIAVKESSQLKDIRSYFDWEKKEATYWEKKVKKRIKKEKKKKVVWAIEDYSQNVISAPFYLRSFQLTVGKKLKFPVADDGKNIVFSGEVLRKEKVKTEAGEFNTIVVKPQITVDGVFKQMGDIFLWLTDDDRKLLVRLEAEIKIGSLIGKLKSIKY